MNIFIGCSLEELSNSLMSNAQRICFFHTDSQKTVWINGDFGEILSHASSQSSLLLWLKFFSFCAAMFWERERCQQHWIERWWSDGLEAILLQNGSDDLELSETNLAVEKRFKYFNKTVNRRNFNGRYIAAIKTLAYPFLERRHF